MPIFEKVKQQKEIRNLRKDADAEPRHTGKGEQAKRVVDSPGE
jgi:hypothetical protein